MEARHIVSFLRERCGEPEMGEAVEQMNNRLEAFSLGMDRAAKELTVQRDTLLAALSQLISATEFVTPNHDVLTGTDAITCEKEIVAARAAARAAIDRATGGES